MKLTKARNYFRNQKLQSVATKWNPKRISWTKIVNRKKIINQVDPLRLISIDSDTEKNKFRERIQDSKKKLRLAALAI
jgi:hypothetical protein